MISLVEVPDPERARAAGVRGDAVVVEPDGEALHRFAALAERKVLRPQVRRIFPLHEAAAAHEAGEAGHVRGKLVLAL